LETEFFAEVPDCIAIYPREALRSVTTSLLLSANTESLYCSSFLTLPIAAAVGHQIQWTVIRGKLKEE